MTAAEALGPRQTVRCTCRHQIFDGIVIRARVVRLLPTGGAEALCRCKAWVPVPVTYSSLAAGRTGAVVEPAGGRIRAQA